MKRKRTKDSSTILCDQSFTKSSWKNTSSSAVLCAVVRKDLVGHSRSLPSEFRAECLVMESQMLFQDQQQLHNE